MKFCWDAFIRSNSIWKTRQSDWNLKLLHYIRYSIRFNALPNFEEAIIKRNK